MCGCVRNLTPAELKSQEYLRSEKKVSRSLAQVIKSFSINEIPNSIHICPAKMNINPNNKEASMWWICKGWLSGNATMALIECQEEPDGKITIIKKYAQNDPWENHVDRFFETLN